MKTYTDDEIKMMRMVIADRGHDAFNWNTRSTIEFFEALTAKYEIDLDTCLEGAVIALALLIVLIGTASLVGGV